MTDAPGSPNDANDGNVPERVKVLQDGYRKKGGSSNYEWRWYGKWWNREQWKMETYISPDYKGRIDVGVLDSWLLLDENATVALDQMCICAFHEIIERICGRIKEFGPLPRSTPAYRVAAARHPLGIVLHGQRLRTGETLQLVASIEHNKPIWMFIGACLYKILVKAQGEEPQGEGDGRRNWPEFVDCVKNTLGLLGQRGLTKLYPPIEELTEQKINTVAEYFLKWDSTVGEKEKDIIADIHTVFCGAPRNRPDGITPEGEHREYMAHVPHMFEWYLLKTVREKLDVERYTVAKGTFPFPRRERFEKNTLEPDIVIRQVDNNGGLVRACIDAKLKISGVKDRNDMYQMAVYTDALERHNRRPENQVEAPGHIRGVVFVAVYGTKPGSDDDDDPHIEGEPGEIRFMFCHLHKLVEGEVEGRKVEKDEFKEELDVKVDLALKFLGICPDEPSTTATQETPVRQNQRDMIDGDAR